MGFRDFIESKKSDIANLQADSIISVFHGTSLIVAYDFCVNGIDAKHINHHRVYSNHTSGGKQLKFGIFIAPDVDTAFKFGSCVVKFKALGKDLIHMFPAEMSKNNEYWKKKYPNSFRPVVSNELLNNSVEPQALFIGLVSPRAIEKVYSWRQGVGAIPMSREQFIQDAEDKDEKIKHGKSAFEPQQYKMNLKDFVRKIAKDEGKSEQEILNILKMVYKSHGYLTGIGKIPYSLLKRIENQVRNLLKNG